MKRLGLVAGSLIVGTLVGAYFFHTGSFAPGWKDVLGLESQAEAIDAPEDADHGHEEKSSASAKSAEAEAGHEEKNTKVAIADKQIDQSKISVQPAQAGLLRTRLRAPGTIIPDRNRVGRVPSKVVGAVAELRKRLGDSVRAGEVIAILDSREVADAKSEYLAAIVNFRLQETLFEREKTLWEKRVSSEQRLLRADATFREAQVRRDVAKQKLSALGVGEEAVARLANAVEETTGLERYEIKAPISGRIVEQFVDIGTPMGGEGQAHELYAIADLSKVWVELTVSPQDLPSIKEGQRLTIEGTATSDGAIIFISPLLNQDTRSARVIASVDNRDGAWRPGSFVNADIAVSESKADLVIPKAALQTIEGETRVFVRTAEGFESRQITVGEDDGKAVEVLTGLKAGEPIAVANTFLLKAELGKSEAEHDH
ncbi:efflux RND transporter periplasmic adaptor subunit [Hyphomicrobium sp.]|uniref:efflux RND transporter periplasmic adaptor subunit n=1 Tax=Hyphomicrobium sp. TaxID=82 RepID=UPI000FA6DCCB|nr:efflux RND transporter periplasmic adaptor subunit [Hyphomicrobium sp.]RUO99259.1 MAG: efflux RND transporter periplasmic adaptor subunit [Hyphomicrobium sp.]